MSLTTHLPNLTIKADVISMLISRDLDDTFSLFHSLVNVQSKKQYYRMFEGRTLE